MRQLVAPVGSLALVATAALASGQDRPSVTVQATPSLPSPSTSCAGGMIAHFPFSGNSNNQCAPGPGLIVGPAPTADRMGTAAAAYFFDGVDDYVQMQDEPRYDLQAFTIAFLVKPHSFPPMLDPPQGVARGAASLVRKGGVANGTGNFSIQLSDAAGSWPKSGMIMYGHEMAKGQYYAICFQSRIRIDTFTRVAVTVGYRALRIYEDGILKCTMTDVPTPTFNNEPLTLGKPTGGRDHYFNGAIDDLRIYNRVLTASEVKALPSN